MNNNEKDNGLDEIESITDNSVAPAGGDSFSIVETENNDQELAQQIEMRTGVPPAPQTPPGQLQQETVMTIRLAGRTFEKGRSER